MIILFLTEISDANIQIIIIIIFGPIESLDLYVSYHILGIK